MRKLALNDEILLSIQQPARYIGGEVNAVMKAFKSYMICLTAGKIPGVNVFIPHG